MSKVSIVVNTYNEEENVRPMCKAIIGQMESELSSYDYEIIFIDNCSTDTTQAVITALCLENPNVKAIFNARNFGAFRSLVYGILQATGDCVIKLSADFQDPVDMIPKFVREWENGYKIVCGIKTTSKENRIMRFLRTIYYKIIKKLSEVEQIEHFTGFALYDRSFVEVLRDLKDPTPFIRGIVAELGYKRKDIPFQQQKRYKGRTHFNWYQLYDAAMLSFTSYTKSALRLATIAGSIMSLVSIVIAVIYFILKITGLYSYPLGTTPILLAVLVFGSVQVFFIGMLGEYVMSINARIMNRPLVIEDTRINFDS